MKKFMNVFLIFFILVTPSLSKDKKVSFDAKIAWGYIKELASDAMEGRRSGQAGGIMGEEYIASKFKEWGLEPGGENGTYFQNFTFEHFNVEAGTALEIMNGKERRTFYCENDWQVQKFSGSGHFVAKIVFAGYGIHAPDKDYDDYSGIDVKGKLVLFSDKIPSPLRDRLGEAANMENRIKAAQKLGARGALTFNTASILEQYMSGIWFKSELYKDNFVWFSVEDSIMKFVFKELKTDLRYHISEIQKTSKPSSLETEIKAFVSVSTDLDRERPARNVLAKISGTDTNLKNEYVVVGAHMDHLGLDPRGDVFNGANDNGSGTAVAMEIARIMKLNKEKSKRTVIFALWAGEEQGLIGSKYYGKHPLYPMDKTVVNFNMDMVGHGKDEVWLRGVYYGPEIWKILREKLPKGILDYVKTNRGGPGGSDHTPFLNNGVPGFFVHTGGPHFKYHQTRDDIDLIQSKMLKMTGDFVQAAVNIMASEPGNFLVPGRRETNHIKFQTLVNYSFSPLSHVLNRHKNAKDSHVDLQLTIIDEKEGLTRDDSRLDILKKLLSASKEMNKTKGLTPYISANKLSGDIRQDTKGKTTVMMGLKGFNAVRDDPVWAKVMAKQGIYFIIDDKAAFLFNEKGLSQEGIKLIDALNTSGLLLMMKNLDATQAKTLLSSSEKPLILLENNLPEKNVLKMIKEKNSSLGLILGKKEDPSEYFKKLNRAKELLGTEHLLVVNEQCLWGKVGKAQMMKLMAEILKAGYKGLDVFNLFSATLLRTICKARGEDPPLVFASMPY